MTDNDDIDKSEQTIARRPTLPHPPAASLGHFLTYTDGETRRRLAIGPGGLTIGRVAPSDLIVPSPDISRRHCRIDLDGEWAVIADLDSTNGTFLDGNRIEAPVRLRDGAVLSLGSFPFQYERRAAQEIEQQQELEADIQRAADYVRAILPRPVTEG